MSLTPFIAYSAVVFHALPDLIMSGLALAAGVLAFFLPETMGHTLPETVEDTKKIMGVGLKAFVWNITCKCRNRTNRWNRREKTVETA